MARLIDASVFIELKRQGCPLGDTVAEALNVPFALASITAAELLFGVERADTSERRRRSEFVETMLAELQVVPLDLAIARTHARLWAQLESNGARISPYDLIVAATAVARGYSVLTFNVREFERVPN